MIFSDNSGFGISLQLNTAKNMKSGQGLGVFNQVNTFNAAGKLII